MGHAKTSRRIFTWWKVNIADVCVVATANYLCMNLYIFQNFRGKAVIIQQRSVIEKATKGLFLRFSHKPSGTGHENHYDAIVDMESIPFHPIVTQATPATQASSVTQVAETTQATKTTEATETTEAGETTPNYAHAKSKHRLPNLPSLPEFEETFELFDEDLEPKIEPEEEPIPEFEQEKVPEPEFEPKLETTLSSTKYSE